MGSASSKFKKYLQHGDEFAAMQTFQGSSELRRALDPNASYGDHRQHNTALHYAARHGMKHLVRTFLADLGADPNKRNALDETALHCACQLPAAAARSFGARERRAACVTLLLQWRGAGTNADNNKERADTAAQDRDGNTPLHWAAAAGLRRCVELLVAHGAPLFAENRDRLTPCELAARAGHADIAQLLEARMVFSVAAAAVAPTPPHHHQHHYQHHLHSQPSADTVNEDDRLVFDRGNDINNVVDDAADDDDDDEEVYSGLRTQDLQEAKDQLLVETSDMLRIPLFTAEALLRDNEWSREALLEKWIRDPTECCRLAGVRAPPATANLSRRAAVEPEEDDGGAADGGGATNECDSDGSEGGVAVCDICLSAEVTASRGRGAIGMACRHRFCLGCWRRYLTVKIQSGDAHHILCPAYQCHMLVPVDVIERIVSPDTARRYLQFDIRAFVDGNRSIKWCPVAGCGRAVRLPEAEQHQPPFTIVAEPPDVEEAEDGRTSGGGGGGGVAITNVAPTPAAAAAAGGGTTSHAVDCGSAHLFCWECLGEAHAPCGCARWRQWQRRVAEVRPEQLRTGGGATTTSTATTTTTTTTTTTATTTTAPQDAGEKAAPPDSEDAANCLWLVTNCKPCPNCRSPIQKNEGCNHMKCSKCKFDFCWVCQESWKRHSSATGGYFRCNRFEAAQRADERQGALVSEAAARNAHAQELARFLHYYTRFRNHENSARLEAPLLAAARHKMRMLAAAAPGGTGIGGAAHPAAASTHDDAPPPPSTRFVEDGVRELLKARRVLCGSYVHGYYLVDNGYNRAIFESMQNELEEVTERLSELIARPYLRAPRAVIVHATQLARRKRHEFVRAVAKGLAPPETPPSQRRLADAEQPPPATATVAAASQAGGSHDNGADLYRHVADYNMELVIALEMSRLQMIEDKLKQAQAAGRDPTAPPSPQPPAPATEDDDDDGDAENGMLDDQLRLAIQLSLQEAAAAAARSQQRRSSVAPPEPPLPQSPAQADEEEEEEEEEEEATVTSYQRTSADITVDWFLRSLAHRRLDLDGGGGGTSTGECCFKSCGGGGAEDGRFQISDIHEAGFAFCDDPEEEPDQGRLRRSHSTGDLCVRRGGRGGRRTRAPGDEPRYHLDSDHSSQHDERPEDTVMMQRRTRPAATTADDSLNADLEVCDILRPSPPPPPPPLPPPETGNNPFASLRARLCAAHAPRAGHLSKLAVNKSIEMLSGGPAVLTTATGQRARKRQPPSPRRRPRENNASSLTTGALRIRICRSPVTGAPAVSTCSARPLETDSSNEYESETGIPKSPTLFISGVSISRTPEPKSPAVGLALVVAAAAAAVSSSADAAAVAAAAAATVGGRQSRSGSLSVAAGQDAEVAEETTAAAPTTTPPSEVVQDATTNAEEQQLCGSADAEERVPASGEETTSAQSASASEPEREREVFRFPKSSTDGALSSVLHVQESNLSSDDFHEALFLLERSPKARDSKRRKKSKKKDKDKEQERLKEEASSAL